MVTCALSCYINWTLVLSIRKENIKTHSTQSSKKGLISIWHVLFKTKTVGDSVFMNNRIALVFHSSALAWTRLLFSFTCLYLSLAWPWLVFTRRHSSLIRLHLYAFVSHSSALVLPLVSNVSNNHGKGVLFLEL